MPVLGVTRVADGTMNRPGTTERSQFSLDFPFQRDHIYDNKHCVGRRTDRVILIFDRENYSISNKYHYLYERDPADRPNPSLYLDFSKLFRYFMHLYSDYAFILHN